MSQRHSLRTQEYQMQPVLRSLARRLAAAIAILASLTGTGAVYAAPPTVTVVDQTFTDDFSCSFPMTVHFSTRISTRVDGNVTRVVYSNGFYTWTNPANGKTVSGPSNGPGIVTVNADGSSTIGSYGVVYNVTAPGWGKILLTVGYVRITIPADPSQPWVFDVIGGKDQPLSNLCPYMGS
jgi:hypothetical protein